MAGEGSSSWLLVRGRGDRRLSAEVRADELRAHSSTRRPAVQAGDRAVLYAAGWQVIFGLVEIVSDPENDPGRTRWAWRFRLRPVFALDDLREVRGKPPRIATIGVRLGALAGFIEPKKSGDSARVVAAAQILPGGGVELIHQGKPTQGRALLKTGMHRVATCGRASDRAREQAADHVLGERDFAEPGVVAGAGDFPGAAPRVHTSAWSQGASQVPFEAMEERRIAAPQRGRESKSERKYEAFDRGQDP